MSQLRLSIIVPVYNEAKTVSHIMERLSHACPEAQIIYVNDGSQDDSLTILKHHARENDVVLSKENGGKGSAVREGLAHAEGTYTIIQDADLEYDPEDIPKLLTIAESDQLDALLGSRRLKKQERDYTKLRYLLGGNALSMICSILYGNKLTDIMTCYKLINTEVFKSLPLRCHGFDLDAEIVSHIAKRKLQIEESGISYHPRSLEEGKKINWKDFFRCLWTLLRIRFSH